MQHFLFMFTEESCAPWGEPCSGVETRGVYLARQTNGGEPTLCEIRLQIRLFFDPNRVSPAIQQGRNQRVPDEELVTN